MRTKLLLPLVTLAMLATALSASASAPIDGTAKMALNRPFLTQEGPCPAISWVGTLQISGSDGLDGTYGFNLAGLGSRFEGDWWIFEESYTVWDTPFEIDEAGNIVNCEPGNVLIQGFDNGVAHLGNNQFWDSGYVGGASGAFVDLVGSRNYQDGAFTEWDESMEAPVGGPFPIAYEGSFRVESGVVASEEARTDEVQPGELQPGEVQPGRPRHL